MADKIEEVRELAAFVEGYATSTDNDKLYRAAEWLYKLSRDMCSQGYIGCNMGRGCSSDHK